MIKLSATLQKFAEEKETVTNVHGVRENFLIIGDQRAEAAARGEAFVEGDRYGVFTRNVLVSTISLGSPFFESS